MNKVPEILAKQVMYMETNKGWVYKILPDNEDIIDSKSMSFTKDELLLGVGTVCIWEGYWEERDQSIIEIGWGVAPRYQGNGFGSKAVQLILNLAKEDPSHKWGSSIHAFTKTTNIASNRLCEKCGFVFVGESDIDYDGRLLKSNHYEFYL